MNNLQALVSRVGAKRAKEPSLRMLLKASDLPGTNWSVYSQGAFRTGAWGSNPSECALRARRAGYFSALRSFEQSSPRRSLVIQVIPYVTASDAESIVPNMKELLRPNPRSPSAVVEEGEIDRVTVGLSPKYWVYEQIAKSGSGVAKSTRMIGTSVRNIVFALLCGGDTDAWPWVEAISVAALQGSKIRDMLPPLSGDPFSDAAD
jgi:hypothetical protein